MQWQFLLTVYSLHPNTSEAYKMNTIIFLVFSFRENIYVVSTPKMHFPAVPAQDCFCFLNEREPQLTYYYHEPASVDIFPFTSMKYHHNKVSGLVSTLICFVCPWIIHGLSEILLLLILLSDFPGKYIWCSQDHSE